MFSLMLLKTSVAWKFFYKLWFWNHFIIKIGETHLSGFMWYAPGAEFDLPDLENLSSLEPPRCGALPEIPVFLMKGFKKEWFLSIVLIKIKVSNLGILLTTELISSSLTCTRQQFSSSDGRTLRPSFVTHLCFCKK